MHQTEIGTTSTALGSKNKKIKVDTFFKYFLHITSFALNVICSGSP